jgi:hypothetical protein
MDRAKDLRSADKRRAHNGLGSREKITRETEWAKLAFGAQRLH